jgi:hypothetical protein
MPARAIALCTLAVALVAFAGGIVFERWIGTDAAIDWAGLRHKLVLYQTRSTADRAAVSLPVSAPGRTMVALVFGQSNAGNSGETRGPSHRNVFEYYRGRIYEARDPLLGATGDGGSIWTRLAAKAIASGAYDAVVLVPFAVGTAEIARFAPGGSLSDGLLGVIADARKSGLVFTHLLWDQGEADAYAKTSADAYRQRFEAMFAAIRGLGVNAPIYVARATRCAKVRPSEELRNAQAALANPASGVLAGPDLDTLGFAERYDGCHFSTEGLDRAADLWLDALMAPVAPGAPR